MLRPRSQQAPKYDQDSFGNYVAGAAQAGAGGPGGGSNLAAAQKAGGLGDVGPEGTGVPDQAGGGD